MPKPLILASSSPNRRALLERLPLDFTCMSPDIDETRLPNEPLAEMAERLSIAKAQAIAEQYPEAIVIGSDQVAGLGDELIRKPMEHRAAVEQWQKMRGQSIWFYTGVCVARGEEYEAALDATEVKFKPLNDEQIEAYLQIDQPYECCGGFKIEQAGIALTEYVSSDDPTALVGLPLIETVALLEYFGLKVFV
jgi:septum formation protein